MSRVFVAEAPHPQKKVDLSPAERYGTLVMVVTNFEVHRLSLKAVYGKMRMSMMDFCSDDYLLMRGNPTVMMLCALLAAHRSPEQVQLLYWDRYQRDYIIARMRFRDGTMEHTLPQLLPPSGVARTTLDFTDTGALPPLPDDSPIDGVLHDD